MRGYGKEQTDLLQ